MSYCRKLTKHIFFITIFLILLLGGSACSSTTSPGSTTPQSGNTPAAEGNSNTNPEGNTDPEGSTSVSPGNVTSTTPANSPSPSPTPFVGGNVAEPPVQGVPELTIDQMSYTRSARGSSNCTLSVRVYNSGTADAENVSVVADFEKIYTGTQRWQSTSTQFGNPDYVDSDFFSWFSMTPQAAIEEGAAVQYTATVLVDGSPVTSKSSGAVTC